MSQNNIDDLAVQVANFYKAGGRYVLYGSVYPRNFKEGSDPALSYGRTSTCSINIFDSESKTGVVAFLDPVDPAYVMSKVNAFMMTAALDMSADSNTEEYYTTNCVFGPFRGKPIAEFILNGQQADIQAEYSRLKETSAKYPQNKKIADLIHAAVVAKNEGRLKAGASFQTVILEETKTPNNKKVDSRGLTECRTIKITYSKGQKEPYNIEISNFMAPPANGQIGAKFSQAQDKSTLAMNLSEKEMFMLFDEFVKAKELYSRVTEGRRIKYADSKAWKPDSQQSQSSSSAPKTGGSVAIGPNV